MKKLFILTKFDEEPEILAQEAFPNLMLAKRKMELDFNTLKKVLSDNGEEIVDDVLSDFDAVFTYYTPDRRSAEEKAAKAYAIVPHLRQWAIRSVTIDE